MTDGSIIQAHRHAAGARGGQEKEGLGRSGEEFFSKIHSKVDTLGMPRVFLFSRVKPALSRLAWTPRLHEAIALAKSVSMPEKAMRL